MNAVLIRGDWVGKVIDGRFSLLEWLGGSGTCGTFVTELDGPRSQKGTLKLFSAPAQAEDRISTWKAMADLSHVHLVRILHFGRAEVDGSSLVYVVTEFAEEVLSQIIPERPLTADEAREMLGPVLDALSYLHAKGFVHGHLKASNVLVVENEIKLSTDGLEAAGAQALDLKSSDVHNAPESATKPMEPPADIWALGMTIVEALTQELPVWDAASRVEPAVPAALPKPFAEIAQACLRVDPERRCTLGDIRILEGRPKPLLAQTKPTMDLHAAGALAEQKTRANIPIVPLIVGLVLLVAIGIGFAIRSHKTNTAPLQTDTTQQAPPAEPESKPPAAPPSPAARTNERPTSAAAVKGEVLNRVVPDVPRKASDTIQGKVTVAVRVSVDPTGAVTNAEFASHGPSAYFARLAMESAQRWKFKPPQADGRAAASIWLLRYEFGRSGTDVTPVETNP
jgi:TonB family protein